MECVPREIIHVLLHSLRARGLISQATYLGAADALHSARELSRLVRYPVLWPEEAASHESAQCPQ